MVKAYLRYEPAGVFGVISSNANIVYGSDGKTVITSCLEDVGVWNIRQGTQVRMQLPTLATCLHAALRHSACTCPEVLQQHEHMGLCTPG